MTSSGVAPPVRRQRLSVRALMRRDDEVLRAHRIEVPNVLLGILGLT